MKFEKAQRLFKDGQILQLAESPQGRKFLKLRSLSRKQYLERLFIETGQSPHSSSTAAMFKQAYDSGMSTSSVEAVIRKIDAEQRKERSSSHANLVNELYKMKSFDWGGLHQNSLERTIVDNYVKKIWSFDDLSEKIEGDLHTSLRGYVLCSWYNHWTSVLIEDLFRSHKAVLPSIGQVKNIDFFVNDVPFDLKVTYFPEGFVSKIRKEKGFASELVMLKKSAISHGISFDKKQSASRLLENLWNKHEDSSKLSARGLVSKLRSFREGLIFETSQNPSHLIKWLYENQGVRRFDASNRLFLVLVDPRNYFDSWKLKRAIDLLESKITGYLDGLKGAAGSNIQFSWEGKNYVVRSSMIIVKKIYDD